MDDTEFKNACLFWKILISAGKTDLEDLKETHYVSLFHLSFPKSLSHNYVV